MTESPERFPRRQAWSVRRRSPRAVHGLSMLSTVFDLWFDHRPTWYNAVGVVWADPVPAPRGPERPGDEWQRARTVEALSSQVHRRGIAHSPNSSPRGGALPQLSRLAAGFREPREDAVPVCSPSTDNRSARSWSTRAIVVSREGFRCTARQRGAVAERSP
jgi:hypothetical protein